MKMKLKKEKKHNIFNVITILLVLIIICIYLLINYINKNVLKVLISEGEIDAKKMALVIMENSVNENVINILKEDDIFIVNNDKNGDVSHIDFNPIIVNKVLNEVLSIINNNLKKIERGQINDISFINKDEYNIKELKNGVITSIPIGAASKNSLLSNIGPKIPVKISMIGSATGNIETKTKSYGINSAIVEVFIHVEVTEKVIIPFRSKEIKIHNNVPVAIKILQGKVPEYYNGNLSDSSLSIPIDNN